MFYNTNEWKRGLKRVREADFSQMLIIFFLNLLLCHSVLLSEQLANTFAAERCNIWQRPFGRVPCIHLFILQLRRSTERISSGNFQHQEVCLYQVPAIPHYYPHYLRLHPLMHSITEIWEINILMPQALVLCGSYST